MQLSYWEHFLKAPCESRVKIIFDSIWVSWHLLAEHHYLFNTAPEDIASKSHAVVCCIFAMIVFFKAVAHNQHQARPIEANCELKIELMKVWIEFQPKCFPQSEHRKMLRHQILGEIIPHGSKATRLNDWVKTGVGALAAARSLNKISHKSANSPLMGEMGKLGLFFIILFLFRAGGGFTI